MFRRRCCRRVHRALQFGRSPLPASDSEEFPSERMFYRQTGAGPLFAQILSLFGMIGDFIRRHFLPGSEAKKPRTLSATTGPTSVTMPSSALSPRSRSNQPRSGAPRSPRFAASACRRAPDLAPSCASFFHFQMIIPDVAQQFDCATSSMVSWRQLIAMPCLARLRNGRANNQRESGNVRRVRWHS